MSEDVKPLSDTLTDAEIGKILKDQNLDDTADNIDLVRNSRRMVEQKLDELEKGKPVGQILTEVKINSLQKN